MIETGALDGRFRSKATQEVHDLRALCGRLANTSLLTDAKFPVNLMKNVQESQLSDGAK